MLRSCLRVMVPLTLMIGSAISPARGQIAAFGWGGYSYGQYGYAYGCPPVYYEPYCSSYSYGYPYTMPGFWAGYTLPYLYGGGGYYPYRLGYYGYGNRFPYGGGLRSPIYRAGPGFGGYAGYRPGYPGYRGNSALGYRGTYLGGASRFATGGFRGGSFRGGGRR
jgi:hypothetical protein